MSRLGAYRWRIAIVAIVAALGGAIAGPRIHRAIAGSGNAVNNPPRASGGGGAGTVTTASPVSGDGSSGTPVTIANNAIALAKLANASSAGVIGATASGAWTTISSLPTQATWFATTLARIQSYDATLTDVVIYDEMMSVAVGWDASVFNGATLTATGSPSAVDLNANTTSGGLSVLTLHDQASGVTGLNKAVSNMKTSHWAMAVRVTKIATIASSNNQMCHLTDGVGTAVPILGMIGATSTTNYSIKAGSSAAVDTGVAQSAAGTYDTLILVNDGTNLKADINSALASTQANTNVNASFGIPQLVANQSATANSAFRVDKVLFVVAGAN